MESASGYPMVDITVVIYLRSDTGGAGDLHTLCEEMEILYLETVPGPARYTGSPSPYRQYPVTMQSNNSVGPYVRKLHLADYFMKVPVSGTI